MESFILLLVIVPRFVLVGCGNVSFTSSQGFVIDCLDRLIVVVFPFINKTYSALHVADNSQYILKQSISLLND
jgi:hypothetical protein